MKRAILVLAAVACSLLMVSTATAVPVAEKKALERTSNGLKELLQRLIDALKCLAVYPAILVTLATEYLKGLIGAAAGIFQGLFDAFKALLKLDLAGVMDGIVVSFVCSILTVILAIAEIFSPSNALVVALLAAISALFN